MKRCFRPARLPLASSHGRGRRATGACLRHVRASLNDLAPDRLVALGRCLDSSPHLSRLVVRVSLFRVCLVIGCGMYLVIGCGMCLATRCRVSLATRCRVSLFTGHGSLACRSRSGHLSRIRFGSRQVPFGRWCGIGNQSRECEQSDRHIWD